MCWEDKFWHFNNGEEYSSSPSSKLGRAPEISSVWPSTLPYPGAPLYTARAGSIWTIGPGRHRQIGSTHCGAYNRKRGRAKQEVRLVNQVGSQRLV